MTNANDQGPAGVICLFSSIGQILRMVQDCVIVLGIIDVVICDQTATLWRNHGQKMHEGCRGALPATDLGDPVMTLVGSVDKS